MTRTAFARALGVGRARLYQLITMGMPTTSLEEAQQWRALNTSRRAPTNGQNVGMIMTPMRSPRSESWKRVSFQPTGDSLFDMLQQARMAQRLAFDLFADAVANDE